MVDDILSNPVSKLFTCCWGHPTLSRAPSSCKLLAPGYGLTHLLRGLASELLATDRNTCQLLVSI
jgi:hypothetical protein